MSNDGDDHHERGSTTGRRGLLRAAAAAGVTLPALSGLGGAASNAAVGANADAAATDGSDAGSGDVAWCPPCIDRLAGYNALSSDEPLPEEIPEPDHTVEMRIDDADVVFPEECDSPDDPPTSIDPTDGGDVEDAADEAMPDFYFDPVGLRVRPGDVVTFPNVSPDIHTVSAWAPRFFGLQQRIPEGAPPFGSPVITPGEEWVYRFPEPGVYDVLCLPHLDLGMVMRIVVTPEGGEVPEAPPVDAESTPPVPAAVLTAPELDPQNIVAEGTVAWTALRDSVPAFDPNELFGE